ncbi:hypothetical protein ACS5PM_08005 [Ideonella sp. YS5]
MSRTAPAPFALSLSKGLLATHQGFDRLSPNGEGLRSPFALSLSKGPGAQGFDKLSQNGEEASARTTPPFTLSLSKGPMHKRIEASHV